MKKDLLFIILGLTIVSSITLPVGWYLGSLIEEEGNGEKARETVLPAEKPSSAELAMVESAADMSPTTPAGGNAETPGTHDSVKEQEVALAARHGTEEGRGSVYKAQEGAASTQAAVPGAQGGAASEQSAASPQSAGVPANGQLADNAILTLSAVFIGGGVAGCILGVVLAALIMVTLKQPVSLKVTPQAAGLFGGIAAVIGSLLDLHAGGNGSTGAAVGVLVGAVIGTIAGAIVGYD